ncbi:biliverdin-producing heme oxygenase [Sphingomonas sp.]|uniref:biliverdin-producing heme oxygenase n=1 Tax=Sphingomonas sp. TaxID=28214 RepID=UPI001ECDBE50|nr:biliverdin-producing heme oxygenase [Sphingomonas sp.]MBX3594589.1 biliverdin-producing heme oxygenase [Sphingomonas sp.]
MNVPVSARQILRAATAPDHARVDTAFSGFELGVRGSYTAFLRAQAAALLPVEAAIDACPDLPVTDWPERQRGDALRADLAELGAALPAPLSAPELIGAAQVLGALYVLEGARLGGKLLVRSVPDTLPRRFLGARQDAEKWRGLIQILDRALVTERQRATATDTARRIFAMFEESAMRHGRTSCFE